jgi:hypothetical protein
MSVTRPEPAAVAREARALPAWTGPALLAAVVAAAVWGVGEPTPAGLALLALCVAALVTAALRRAPLAAAAALPLLLLSPQFLKIYAYEPVLVALAAGLVVAGVQSRASWVTRLDPIELAVAAFLGWAVVSGFWCRDLWWYAFGLRKLGIGLVSLWTAWRLARLVGAGPVQTGIALGAFGIATETLIRAFTFGMAAAGTTVSRRDSTDIGWGNSNFIAAILTLTIPTLLALTVGRGRPAARTLAWITLPLVAGVAVVAVSRGGAILFVIGVLVFLFRQRPGRRQLAMVGAAALSILALVAGPGGARLAGRFTSAREQGSALIRLLFWREGWRRFVAHLPWGMGQGQGYVASDHLGSEDPHNYWLVVGPELGVVGLAIWVAILVLLWRRASALARDARTRDLGQALQLTIVLSQLNSLFEPTFQGLQYHFFFYWIAGALLGAAAARTASAA